MGLLQQASLVVTPNAYKASKLYSVIPTNGTGDLDVVRATSATRVNSAGVIESVGNNIPRLDYTNASCPSILIEPQRTNLVFPSNTATTQTRTVTAVAHTLSFYGTGSVTLSGVATGTLNGTGANNRVTLTFTPTAGSLVLTVTGSVTNWQLEAGANATSLIQTVSTSVTRNADVISKSGISSLIGQTEGTLFLDASSFNFLGNGAGERVGFTNGTFNFRIQIDLNYLNNSVSLIGGNSTTGLTGTITSTSNIISTNNRFKIAIAYNGSNSVLYVNGVAFTTITGTIPTFNGELSVVEFNQGNGSRPFYGKINNLIAFKTRLTNTQLQQLTTL